MAGRRPSSFVSGTSFADFAVEVLKPAGRPVGCHVDDAAVFSWNARWLVDPSAGGNNAARAVSGRHLER
eukprot:413565-Alexandrium_andersonii.AAC.1